MFKPILGDKDNATTRQKIEEYLTARNFSFETTENENNLVVPVSGENGNWKVLLCVDEKRSILEVYSFCPVSIKETQKLKIAELISRINNRLLIGYFSISFEECEIVFKTVHLFSDTKITIKSLDIYSAQTPKLLMSIYQQ